MADVDLTDNRQVELKTTVYLTTALALVFVVLRFTARNMKGVGIGMDDYMILVATVSTCIFMMAETDVDNVLVLPSCD